MLESMSDDTHGLSKSTWTHHDFDHMGWHDAQLHAIAMEFADDGEAPGWWLLLDLDYIVRWVEPRHPDTHFTFWTAPATLVFHDAFNVRFSGGIERMDLVEILDLHRSPVAARLSGDPSWDWHVEGDGFDLRVDATGFTQYFRREPIHVPRQELTLAERGGISVSRRAFDGA